MIEQTKEQWSATTNDVSIILLAYGKDKYLCLANHIIRKYGLEVDDDRFQGFCFPSHCAFLDGDEKTLPRVWIESHKRQGISIIPDRWIFWTKVSDREAQRHRLEPPK